MPDFDIDFCMHRRDEVIDYVADKYGRDNVGQIVTMHQLKARGVTRDVCRAMGLSYGEADRVRQADPRADPRAGTSASRRRSCRSPSCASWPTRTPRSRRC